MADIRMRNIRKSFGQVDVLHGVDVDVHDGEFVVLVGPSGCGKSTLLRILAGLESISSGNVEIDEVNVNDRAPKERDIAMVFQNYALYPHMTVAQNMGFSLRLSHTAKDVIAQKVRQAAETLDLAELLERYPRQLSGGQRQRVAMGRAIVRDPKVFLFDEPLSNLDAKLRVQMRAEIKELHQRLSATIVYVTHDQIEAMTMADRIVVLRDGRVEQTGTPLEVFDHPVNRFVAGFIGSPSMNFLAAALEGTTAVVGDNGRLVTSGRPSSATDVILGIRPEDLSVAQEGLAARIIVVEPTGTETHVVASVGQTNVVFTTRERLSIGPGAEIRLIAAPEKIHLFDPESGAVIGEATPEKTAT
jgi:multiple sugar transport system ATP-binding protein